MRVFKLKLKLVAQYTKIKWPLYCLLGECGECYREVSSDLICKNCECYPDYPGSLGVETILEPLH
jgi:hypothetical protein